MECKVSNLFRTQKLSMSLGLAGLIYFPFSIFLVSYHICGYHETTTSGEWNSLRVQNSYNDRGSYCIRTWGNHKVWSVSVGFDLLRFYYEQLPWKYQDDLKNQRRWVLYLKNWLRLYSLLIFCVQTHNHLWV